MQQMRSLGRTQTHADLPADCTALGAEQPAPRTPSGSGLGPCSPELSFASSGILNTTLSRLGVGLLASSLVSVGVPGAVGVPAAQAECRKG